ncbi:hypothetical protein SAMN02745116_00141 [Pilibacter termitis]|uniref:Uncharacterized protein n=2 Tax=Pilibacter termitis TaxID=263852 RepID=A0A1T4K7U1_9ENTE|nr:hypothetical protein SAMN02745116_00141 [Pilibacter termitis]
MKKSIIITLLGLFAIITGSFVHTLTSKQEVRKIADSIVQEQGRFTGVLIEQEPHTLPAKSEILQNEPSEKGRMEFEKRTSTNEKKEFQLTKEE